MRLGSREPLQPDPADPKQPRPIAAGFVTRRGTVPGAAGEAGPGAKPASGAEPSAQAETTAKPGPTAEGQTSAKTAIRSKATMSDKAKPSAKSRPALKSELPAARFAFALPRPDEPALALIESASIAVGFLVTDTIVKKAPVRVLRAQTASPGKFLVLFTGDVASVEEAHQAGLAAAGDSLLDELMLPGAHAAVLPALEGLTHEFELDSFAVIETFSFAAAIMAADVAVKTAPVGLIEVRPPVGMGGKSFLTLTGGLEDLQVAVDLALERIRPGGMICRHVLIPNPHGDLGPFVF